jgi:hypothetical protein
LVFKPLSSERGFRCFTRNISLFMLPDDPRTLISLEAQVVSAGVKKDLVYTKFDHIADQ